MAAKCFGGGGKRAEPLCRAAEFGHCPWRRNGPRLRLTGCERKTRREPIRGGSHAPSMARDGLPLASGQPHPLIQFRLKVLRHRQVAVGSVSRIRRDHDLVTPRFPIHPRQRSMLLSAPSDTRTPTATRQRNRAQRARTREVSAQPHQFRRGSGDCRAPWTARASPHGWVHGVSPEPLRKPARPRASANAARAATAAPTKDVNGPARAPSRSPRRPAPTAATPGSPGPTTA